LLARNLFLSKAICDSAVPNIVSAVSRR